MSADARFYVCMLPALHEKDETKKHQMQCRGEGFTGTIRMYVAGIDNNDDLADLFIDLVAQSQVLQSR